MLRLANISNGLAFPHDDVCNFQSQFGHHCSLGYFRIDSMPYSAVIHVLRGGQITVIDATGKDKPLSDALRYGVPTWCIVMNRAMRLDYENIRVCEWQTKEMVRAAKEHRPYVKTIRKLINIFGNPENPVLINDQILLECHRMFEFDDKMGECPAPRGGRVSRRYA